MLLFERALPKVIESPSCLKELPTGSMWAWSFTCCKVGLGKPEPLCRVRDKMQCLVEVVQDGELVLIVLRPGKPLQQAPPNPQVHRTALLRVQLAVSSLQQQCIHQWP
jgi:hypothetical protein